MDDPAPNLSRTGRFIERELKDIKSLNFWRAVAAEYMGTLMLCLWSIGCGVHHSDDDSPPDIFTIAIGTGFVVATLINTLINVSGGHVNPALSIGFLVLGKITCLRFLFFVITQCLACLSAVGILKQLVPPEMVGLPGLISPGTGVTGLQAFVFEFLITFLLLFAVAAYIDSRREDDMSPAPMYVGLLVASNIIFAGRTSGGCMNPARNFGPAIVSGQTETQWIYWLGPLLGGATGSLVYDKLMSARAMSGSLLYPCCGKKVSDSSESNIASSINENEKERMLTTET